MKKINRWSLLIYLMVILMFVLSFEFINASAAETDSPLSITGYRTTNDGIVVFIKNGSLTSELPVIQIGSDSCEKIETIKEFPRKTLILLDNSKSVSSSWKKETIDLISSVIKEHTEGEKFKIVTYANGMTVWADYSDDYDNLLSITQNIPFKKQKSYLTDIFYELLAAESKDESGAYIRFIIISDGADHNEITYTQDELKELIKKSGISINAVGINKENNADALNLLFSYVRLTNGNSIVVKKGDNPLEATEMLVNEDISGLKLIPNQSLWDGSSKETRIIFQLESGEFSLRAVLEMPFADIGSLNKQGDSPEPETESDNAPVESDYLPMEPSEEESKDNSLFLIITIIGGSVFLISVILIIIVITKKKKQDEETKKWEYLDDDDPIVIKQQEITGSGMDGQTMPLWPEYDEDKGKTQKAYVVLTSLSTNKIFKAQVDDKIIIGRNTGLDISLNFDGAVSGKHCEIYRNGNDYYIKDLNSSNGTFFNKTRITAEGKKIQSDGIINIGQDSYKLTIEHNGV